MRKTPKAQVDAQLARYRAMRDFAVTNEPSGGSGGFPPGGEVLPFVIQKHAATRLHYDFRLGWRGVLKSWACAKGPSYSTADRRLAVEVEDHPIEYGGFEGAIPKGEYGGGTVLVWDQGTWEPAPGVDFDEGLRKGSLKFVLHGQKLQGRWTLVRMGGKAAREGKPNWLLIKEHDGKERPAGAPAITEEAPNSVVTGRSLEQIAGAEDHIWHSHEVEKPSAPPARSRLQDKVQKARAGRKPAARAAKSDGRQPASGSPKPRTRKSPARRAEPLNRATPKQSVKPGFIPPQLATPSEKLPPGSGWLHELKLDGYRIQAHIAGGQATLYTRTGLDWTHRMRPVAEALAKLPAGEAILDGELIVREASGSANFSKLQAAFENGGDTLSYIAFDLLFLGGRDLRPEPLHARKALLEPLLANMDSAVGFSAHLQLGADEVYAHACALGAEGLLSKQADAPYTSGRSAAWLKLKCLQRQEFVVAGFTPPVDGGLGVGALLLGFYENGKLVHCGRCGTGFTHAGARELRQQLEPLREAKSPYADRLDAFQRRDALWVRPALVAEVQFTSWTDDRQVRHASFRGLRSDKPASEVTREQPTPDKPEPRLAARQESSVTHTRTRTRTVNLTHPDKVLDPQTGVTKQDLYAFYEAVAPMLLPQLAGRPTSIVRCPDGVSKPSFFQKHVKTGLPKSLEGIPVPGDPDPYIGIGSAEALLALAQFNVLELHPWLSTAENLEKPDRLILDLDPDESLPWNALAESALAIRGLLGELQLKSWVKTTGGKGLHLVAPIEPRLAWPEMKEFAHSLAAVIESTNPKLYLIKMTKAARAGRIFIDWMRNERGSTAVAAWSPRARPGLRVAVPLAWSELPRGPFSFAVHDFAGWRQRLDQNPWAEMRPQPLLPEVAAAVGEQTAAPSRTRRKR